MSIQTTVTITRNEAIDRILLINQITYEQDYRYLERETYETDYNAVDFVSLPSIFYTEAMLNKYTNKMLEDIMSSPFYRFSLFCNYSVVE